MITKLHMMSWMGPQDRKRTLKGKERRSRGGERRKAEEDEEGKRKEICVKWGFSEP